MIRFHSSVHPYSPFLYHFFSVCVFWLLDHIPPTPASVSPGFFWTLLLKAIMSTVSFTKFRALFVPFHSFFFYATSVCHEYDFFCFSAHHHYHHHHHPFIHPSHIIFPLCIELFPFRLPHGLEVTKKGLTSARCSITIGCLHLERTPTSNKILIPPSRFLQLPQKFTR